MNIPAYEIRRAPEGPPIKEGWYYAYMPAADSREPIPWLVLGPPDDLTAFNPFDLDGDGIPLSQFKWFGAVPICVESGT